MGLSLVVQMGWGETSLRWTSVCVLPVSVSALTVRPVTSTHVFFKDRTTPASVQLQISAWAQSTCHWVLGTQWLGAALLSTQITNNGSARRFWSIMGQGFLSYERLTRTSWSWGMLGWDRILAFTLFSLHVQDWFLHRAATDTSAKEAASAPVCHTP